MTSHRVNMNPFPARQLVALEPYMAFLKAEESVILAHADIVPRVEASPPLADNEVSRFHFLEK